MEVNAQMREGKREKNRNKRDESLETFIHRFILRMKGSRRRKREEEARKHQGIPCDLQHERVT